MPGSSALPACYRSVALMSSPSSSSPSTLLHEALCAAHFSCLPPPGAPSCALLLLQLKAARGWLLHLRSKLPPGLSRPDSPWLGPHISSFTSHMSLKLSPPFLPTAAALMQPGVTWGMSVAHSCSLCFQIHHLSVLPPGVTSSPFSVQPPCPSDIAVVVCLSLWLYSED